LIWKYYWSSQTTLEVGQFMCWSNKTLRSSGPFRLKRNWRRCGLV
jgi:hypothetical protein